MGLLQILKSILRDTQIINCFQIFLFKITDFKDDIFFVIFSSLIYIYIYKEREGEKGDEDV